jgi:hypothetical protein
LIEDRVFAAIKRRLRSLDVHGLNDVADRAMNEGGKEMGDLGERPRQRGARHMFLMKEAEAQHSPSPAVAY